MRHCARPRSATQRSAAASVSLGSRLAVNEAAFGPGAVEPIPALFEETVRQADAALAPGDPLWPMLADTWMAAGFSFWYSPNERMSASFYRRALEIQLRELPPLHAQVGETVSQLAGVLNRAGELREAEELLRAGVARVFHPGSAREDIVAAVSKLAEDARADT